MCVDVCGCMCSCVREFRAKETFAPLSKVMNGRYAGHRHHGVPHDDRRCLGDNGQAEAVD